MGDGSSSSILKSLKKEWALFWQAFQGDEEGEIKVDHAHEKLEELSLDEIREVTKGLTEDRMKLNQKLETVVKEIDINSDKLESLRLVGGTEEHTLQRIHELNDLGQSMTEAMEKVDYKLREARTQEAILHEEEEASS